MGRFNLAELPPALAEHVPAQARLAYPRQGMTSDVAFAEQAGAVVVVKRCAHPVYLDWLRREQIVLRALGGAGLPIPQFIAYAEADAQGAPVGWLITSRLAGSPLLRAAIDASPAWRETVLRQLHSTRVPPQLLEGGTLLSRQLALATKPELELSVEVLDAFYAGYRGAALDDSTRDWFVRLYDYF